jgi:hypothetical protein
VIFDTPGDVISAVSDLQSDMSLLYARFEEDYDLVRGTLYESEEKGYESYTSPTPRNYFEKIMDGLNRAEIQIAIKLGETATDKDKQAASIGELFLYGALNDIDRQLRNKGEPRLRKSLGWLIGARGWCCMRALVYVPEDEENVIFDVMPWDPLHTVWEQGDNGLVWAAYTRWVTPTQAKDEWDIDTNEKLTRVIDVWDRHDNAIIVGSEWDHSKPPTAHNIGHVPVYVSAVGSMPTITRDVGVVGYGGTAPIQDSTLEDRGDSIFTASRKLYKARNRHVSQLMDMHKRGVVGSVIFASEDGKKSLPHDIHRAWQAIKLKFGREEIKPIEMPAPPESTGPLLSIMDRDIEMSTLPYPMAYGGADQPFSGRALAMLTDATKSNYTPRTEALATSYVWLTEELLSQFKDKITKPATMRGFKGFEESSPYFSQEVKPEEIDKAWFITVQVEPKLPRDQESEILMAIQATSARPGQQALYSMGTAREDILKMRDPHAEEQKALAEIGLSHPKVIEARIVAALRARGENDAADVIEKMEAEGPPTGAAGPPPGSAGAPPSPNGDQQQIPPEAQQLIREILRVLTDAGRNDLAQAFTETVQSRQPAPPELAEAILEVAVQRGETQVAEIFAEALGVQPQQGTVPRPTA